MHERALILDAMELIYLARCGLLNALGHVQPQPVMVGLVAAREALRFADLLDQFVAKGAMEPRDRDRALRRCLPG